MGSDFVHNTSGRGPSASLISLDTIISALCPHLLAGRRFNLGEAFWRLTPSWGLRVIMGSSVVTGGERALVLCGGDFLTWVSCCLLAAVDTGPSAWFRTSALAGSGHASHSDQSHASSYIVPRCYPDAPVVPGSASTSSRAWVAPPGTPTSFCPLLSSICFISSAPSPKLQARFSRDYLASSPLSAQDFDKQGL